jgi:Thiamine pyrophosphate-requiring enzymes [acetolactate synthase, pyruvate dehydrogenase (cytochrome), glyoxylate carboligase, phosphonopyruvate decarboxylase]
MLIACERATVRDTTYDLLRRLDLRVIFGNPGSTEEPFLKEFPADFQYILALQEASAIAMADGYSQATKRPALVNLHTAAGVGNAMGTLMTAYQNKTPLIVIAGQQTREMLISEPFLTNRDETMMPRPWVKWSYQPPRAQDVPAAIMRAYAMALQPPAGPVFLSIPLDDWEKPSEGITVIKSVSRRVAPDPQRLEIFADRINGCANPAIVYGGDIDRTDAWNEAVEFAERLQCPVFAAPLSERGTFPETHKQFQGMLPPAIGPLSDKLDGFDLVIVIGAPVFRYYPYVGGEFLRDGTELIHITDDSNEASTAVVGDSLLSDSKLALRALLKHVPERNRPTYSSYKTERSLEDKATGARISAEQLFEALSEVRPDDAIVVQESPSNYRQFAKWWPTEQPHSYFSYASGGLGWNAPAAVGLALAEEEKLVARPVIAFIGDGAMQYSIQSLYTAARRNLKIIYVIPCNEEYAVLKSFAELEKTPGVPGLDLVGLDILSLAKGYGCRGVKASDTTSLKTAFKEALEHNGPTVITVAIERGFKALV